MWRHGNTAGTMLVVLVLCHPVVGADPPRGVLADSVAAPIAGQTLSPRKTAEKMRAHQPVTIVCLGDSVTGVYYHTGGRRAYPEMLAVALKTQFPKSDVTVVNAGVSGNSTVDGLKRLRKDVLDRKPDLVTVMFGLNDMVRVPLADFQANLERIIEQCRARGAEVLLATPNSVIDTPGRPAVRLVEYCDAIRTVARRCQTPVCDVYAAYDALRRSDSLSWRMLLSDEIHPNMDGHKLNAETLCAAITGQSVSLRAAGPPRPAIPETRVLLKAGKPVRVLAMPPYDKLIGPALRAAVAGARVEVDLWPTDGRTLSQIEESAKRIRTSPPDLVVIAVPAAVTPDAAAPPEDAIRAYTWILNWSLSFGRRQWDVVGIAPSVLKADLTAAEKGAEEFARRKILAQDLSPLVRPNGVVASPEEILVDWLREELADK